jgi:hypothetical protein
MIITGLGHYVGIIAEGGGNSLWYSEQGSWVEDESLKKVFTGVPSAVHTPILNLPSGYHARIIYLEVEVPPQVEEAQCCCNSI